MVLVSNLDDGHISSIGRVLEIKAKELVVFIFIMPSLQVGKKTRDNLAIVGVGDLEKGFAWCKHRGKLMTDFFHGGGSGKKERARGRGREEEEEEPVL